MALLPRHTKEAALRTLVLPQLEYPYNDTETEKVEKVQRTAANTSSINDMLDELKLKSSLTFFYKIHSGTVSLDKDIYLTPAARLSQDIPGHLMIYSTRDRDFPGLILGPIMGPFPN